MEIISIQYIFPSRYFYVLKHFLIDYIIHRLPVDVSHIQLVCIIGEEDKLPPNSFLILQIEETKRDIERIEMVFVMTHSKGFVGETKQLTKKIE